MKKFKSIEELQKFIEGCKKLNMFTTARIAENMGVGLLDKEDSGKQKIRNVKTKKQERKQ
jgi:hypothetical protein